MARMFRRRAGRSLRWVTVFLVGAMIIGFGMGSASATPRQSLTKVQWRQLIAHAPVPGRGCFAGSYPSLKWREVRCHAAPKVPYVPRAVHAAAGPVSEVGDGYDYSAVTSASISAATGSFPYVSPGASEKGIDYVTGKSKANTYSLQLNTEFFYGSAACAKAKTPSSCLAWEQFVYSSTYGGVFIQYWLINYDASCPKTGGWIKYSTDCYTNSDGTFLTGTPPTISKLNTVSLTGTAGSSNDAVTMAYNGTANADSFPDSEIGLLGHWNTAEFAIIGDGNGTQAVFSSGSKLDVLTSVNHGSTTAPRCVFEGFTAESNNLYFASPPKVTAGSNPEIETQQTTNGDNTDCAAVPQGGTDTITVADPGQRASTVGKAASSVQVKATDSASGQTLTWSASGLPPGLKMSSSGRISGTPTKAGTYLPTVTAKDSTGAAGSSTFFWITSDKVTVTSPGKQTSTVGKSVRLRIKATDSASGQTFKWSASKLPKGLKISSTGVVTGKPTKAGTSRVTVTAKDKTGAMGSASFNWAVHS